MAEVLADRLQATRLRLIDLYRLPARSDNDQLNDAMITRIGPALLSHDLVELPVLEHGKLHPLIQSAREVGVDSPIGCSRCGPHHGDAHRAIMKA
jgi:hypothetical protein